MKKKEMNDYEELDPLTASDVKKNPTIEILEVKTVTTKFADDQPLIKVLHNMEKKAWWGNWTSLNGLIDLFGENEAKMINQIVTLEIVKQPVKGKMKDVIYLEGVLKEEG